MRVFVVTAFLCIWSCTAVGQSNGAYYCVPEISGGLAYDEATKKWVGSVFRVSSYPRFIMKVTGNRITITDSGSNVARPCEPTSSRSQTDGPLTFRCVSSLVDYVFDLRTNRYMAIYTIGYTNGEDNNNNTPLVAGGTCTRID